MPRERLRRYSFRRTSRPRKWSPYLVTSAPTASHAAPKTGGYASVRRERIMQMREDEAATLTVNEETLS